MSRRAEAHLFSIRRRRSSALGLHSVLYRRINLVHRRAQVVSPAPVKRAQVIHNTVYQTIVHVHQTTLQHIRRQINAASYLRQDAFLLVLLQPAAPRRGDRLDPAQPTRAAHALLRIFSKESARREMRPFYSDVVRGVLQEEQERYKSRPTKAISLIWNLFGQHNAFRTLTRFYLGTVGKLGSNYFPALSGANSLYLAAGVLMHSRVYQRYIHQLWSQETHTLPLRYAPGRGLSQKICFDFPWQSGPSCRPGMSWSAWYVPWIRTVPIPLCPLPRPRRRFGSASRTSGRWCAA